MVKQALNETREGTKSIANGIGSVAGGALGTALTAAVPYGAYKAGEALEKTTTGSTEVIGQTLEKVGETSTEGLSRTADKITDLAQYITPDFIEEALIKAGTMTANAAKGAAEWLANIPPESRIDIASKYGGIGAEYGLTGIEFLTTGTLGAALTYKLPILINIIGQGLVLNTIHKATEAITATGTSVKERANKGGRANGKRRGKLTGGVTGLATIIPASSYHLAKAGLKGGKEFLQFAGKTVDGFLGVGQAMFNGLKRCVSGKGGLRGNIKESGKDIRKARKNIYQHDIERTKTGVKRIDDFVSMGHKGQNTTIQTEKKTEKPKEEKKENSDKRPRRKFRGKKEKKKNLEEKKDDKKKTIKDNIEQKKSQKEEHPSPINIKNAEIFEAKRNTLTQEAIKETEQEKKQTILKEAIKKGDEATLEDPQNYKLRDGLAVSQMLMANSYEENTKPQIDRYTKAMDSMLLAIKLDPNTEERKENQQTPSKHQEAFARIKKLIEEISPEKKKESNLKVEHKKEQPAKEKKA